MSVEEIMKQTGAIETKNPFDRSKDYNPFTGKKTRKAIERDKKLVHDWIADLRKQREEAFAEIREHRAKLREEFLRNCKRSHNLDSEHKNPLSLLPVGKERLSKEQS